MALSDLENIVHRALTAGLVGHEKRPQLMRGLPMGFVYSLPTVGRPIDQLRFDLMELNRTPRLIGLKAPPLAVWLKNAAEAVAQAGNEEAARFFAERADAAYPTGDAQGAVDELFGRVGAEVARTAWPSPGAAAAAGGRANASASHSSRRVGERTDGVTWPRDRRMFVVTLHPDAASGFTMTEPPIEPGPNQFQITTYPGRWWEAHRPGTAPWINAVKNLDEQLADIRQRLRPRDCLAVFPLAPPALGALLGARLREQLSGVDAIVVFERVRHRAPPWQPFGPSWSATVQPEPERRLSLLPLPAGNGRHVAVMIELGERIDHPAVDAALEALEPVPRAEIELDHNPTRSSDIDHPVAIETAFRDLREYVRTVAARYRRASTLHLFYTGPLALIVRLGTYLAEQRIRATVYVDRGSEGYLPAVEVGGRTGSTVVEPSGSPVRRPEGPYDIFLTAADDSERSLSEALYATLVDMGLRVFHPQRSLRLGDIWTRKVPDALKRSRHIVVLVSAAAADDWYGDDLLARALADTESQGSARVVYPILLDGLPPSALPHGLGQVHPLLASRDDIDGIARAIGDAIKTRDGSTGRAADDEAAT